MAVAPPHICRRCNVLVHGRCPTCVRTQDQARGTAHQRHYTRAWAAFSKQWLARFPWCGMRQDGQLAAEHSQCVQRQLWTRAACTDHIQAMAAGGAQYDPANLQSLCADCNRRKNIALEGGFGR